MKTKSTATLPQRLFPHIDTSARICERLILFGVRGASERASVDACARALTSCRRHRRAQSAASVASDRDQTKYTHTRGENGGRKKGEPKK